MLRRVFRAMVRSRIVLGPLPPLLADLVRQLLDDGTEVWDTTSADRDSLIDAAARHGANVVVVTANQNTAPNQYLALSSKLPGIALATLDERGRTGARYSNGQLEWTCDELTPQALRRLLRPP